MIPILIRYNSAEIHIEYDESDEFEVLIAQVKSIVGLDLDIDLLDASSRLLVRSDKDLLRLYDDKKLELVCVEKNIGSAICTREILGDEECIQPAFAIDGSSIILCTHCATRKLDSSLVSPMRFLTSTSCQSGQALEIGLLYRNESVSGSEKRVPAELLSGTKMYIKGQLLASALDQQLKNGGPEGGGPLQDFKRQLASGLQTVMTYEDAEQQAAARDVLDYPKIKEEADKYAQEVPDSAEDVRFMMGLLRWFKHDFFKWCNKPSCEHADCQAPPSRMGNARMDTPNEYEKQIGWASRVEVYQCKECHRETRFARFNKPSHLLETRKGRCGEWANAFCLICRALSLDARYVRDWTDHVWVEVFVPSLGRFAHCDPCEKTFDAPLSYEKGWKKKLTIVVAFSRYGVSDASPRYSRRLSEVVLRRGAGVEPGALREVDIQGAIASKDKEVEESFCAAQRTGYLRGSNNSNSRLRGTFASNTLPLLASTSRLASGKEGFVPLSVLELRIEDMLHRKEDDRHEIAGLMFCDTGSDKDAELRGRDSGDTQWRQQRGELGDNKGSEDPPSPLQKILREATPKNLSYPIHIAPNEAIMKLPVKERDEIIATEVVASGGVEGHVIERSLDDVWRCATTGLPLQDPLPWTPSPLEKSLHTRTRCLLSTSDIDTLRKEEITFTAFEGYWRSACPLVMLKATSNEDNAAFLARALGDAKNLEKCVGFVVTNDGDEAFLFGKAGIPNDIIDSELREVLKSTCYFKKTAMTSTYPEETSPSVDSIHYLPLSGSKHGDTETFDAFATIVETASLLDSGTFEGPLSSNELRVSEIAVWASASFVNGVQVSYETKTGLRIKGRRFLGRNEPTASKQVMVLSQDDTVAKVVVRAGAIVDSVTIVTELGKELKAGGGGGGPPAVIELSAANNLRFIGFFGGLGGHIHNLGVLLQANNTEDMATPPPRTATVKAPPSAFQSFYSFIINERTDLIEWADDKQLLDTLRALSTLHLNPRLLGQVIDAIIAYVVPLATDPADVSKRRVKMSDAVFQKNVIAGGPAGIALFCSGPAKFSAGVGCNNSSLDDGSEGMFFTSNIRLFHEGGSVSRAEVTKDIEDYILFLNIAKERLAISQL